MLLARQVKCDGFSRCYDDVGICLWTNNSQLTQSAAQTACKQQNNSFLPRDINSNIQQKLGLFRTATNSRQGQGISLAQYGFWIDVRAVRDNSWDWIDSSSFAS